MTVVAFVPSAGPVPPPMIVVMPEARASSTICGQMRCTWQSMAPAVRILPLPDRISVDGPITRAGSTPVMVSGLPALPMPTIRPSRTPTSAFTTPQWSRINAPVMTRSGVPSARVRGRLAHRLADHLAATEHGFLTAGAQVALDLDQQIGVGQPNTVAGRRPVQAPVVRAGDLNHQLVRHRGKWSGNVAAQTGDHSVAADRYQRHGAGDSGLEAQRGAGWDVESLAACRRAIEQQRRVGLGEVVVRADLHRAIAAVHHLDAGAGHPGVQFDQSVGSADLAGDHGGVDCSGGDRLVTARTDRRANRLVEGDQLGAIRERCLDLDLVDQLGDAVHHVVAGQHAAAGVHEIDDGATVASGLVHPRGQDGDGLGIVELHPARPALLGDVGGHVHEQAVLFVGRQLHAAGS